MSFYGYSSPLPVFPPLSPSPPPPANWEDEISLMPMEVVALDDQQVSCSSGPDIVSAFSDKLTAYMVELGYLPSTFAMDVGSLQQGSCVLLLRIKFKKGMKKRERKAVLTAVEDFIRSPSPRLAVTLVVRATLRYSANSLAAIALGWIASC